MGKRDVAVTFYLMGLVSGMIVAFASCSTDDPAKYNKPASEQVLPR